MRISRSQTPLHEWPRNSVLIMMQVDVVGWGPSLKLNEEDTLGWYTPAAFDPFLLLAAGRMGTTP